jgi:hypothetical protein
MSIQRKHVVRFGMLVGLACVALFVLVFSVSLRLVGSRSGSPPAGVIDQHGTYSLSPSGNVLSVTEDAGGVVQYVVRDPRGNLLIQDNAGSKYSRWYFVWSDENELWVYSGDIGSVVWLPQDGYSKTTIMNQRTDLIRAMPAAFVEYASPTQKAHWLSFRGAPLE